MKCGNLGSCHPQCLSFRCSYQEIKGKKRLFGHVSLFKKKRKYKFVQCVAVLQSMLGGGRLSSPTWSMCDWEGQLNIDQTMHQGSEQHLKSLLPWAYWNTYWHAHSCVWSRKDTRLKQTDGCCPLFFNETKMTLPCCSQSAVCPTVTDQSNRISEGSTTAGWVQISIDKY